MFDRILKRNKNSIESDDPEKRMAALDEITDEGILEKVASQDPDIEVRRKAISKLSNHYTLLKFYRNDPDFDNRLEALSAMTNLEFLREVYENNCYSKDANERKMSRVAINRYLNVSNGTLTAKRPMDLNDLVNLINEKMAGINPDDENSSLEIDLDTNIIVGPDDEVEYIALTTTDVSGYHKRYVQVARNVFIKGNGHFVFGIADKQDTSYNEITNFLFEIHRECTVKINNLAFRNAPHGVFKISNASLEIYNSIFTDNGDYDNIISVKNARFKAYNCLFKNNHVAYGVINAEEESILEISESDFIENIARGRIVAISVVKDSSLTVSKSKFERNDVDRIGRLLDDSFTISCRNSDASINNSTSDSCEGIYSLFFRSSANQNSLDLTDCKFSRDSSDEIFNYYNIENFHEGNCEYGLDDDL